jgi:hypothetical protein
LSHVPVRKPNRHEFVRTRFEPEFWFGTGVFEDKEERETFIVTPSMREACFLELGWQLPSNVIDLYAEHRVETNGEKPLYGDGLLVLVRKRRCGGSFWTTGFGARTRNAKSWIIALRM